MLKGDKVELSQPFLRKPYKCIKKAAHINLVSNPRSVGMDDSYTDHYNARYDAANKRLCDG